jgi:hypothetical protein
MRRNRNEPSGMYPNFTDGNPVMPGESKNTKMIRIGRHRPFGGGATTFGRGQGEAGRVHLRGNAALLQLRPSPAFFLPLKCV